MDNLSDIDKYQAYMQNRRSKDINKIQNSKSLSEKTKQEYSRDTRDKRVRVGDEKVKNEFKSRKFYAGQCQICGFTFPTNKGNYCERFTWTDFTKGKWEKVDKNRLENRLITKGNSLCLCAKCHSIIKNGGDFETIFLSEKLKEKLKNENYNFDEFLNDINIDKLFKKPECFEFYVEFGDMFVLEIRLNKKNEYDCL